MVAVCPREGLATWSRATSTTCAAGPRGCLRPLPTEFWLDGRGTGHSERIMANRPGSSGVAALGSAGRLDCTARTVVHPRASFQTENIATDFRRCRRHRNSNSAPPRQGCRRPVKHAPVASSSSVQCGRTHAASTPEFRPGDCELFANIALHCRHTPRPAHDGACTDRFIGLILRPAFLDTSLRASGRLHIHVLQSYDLTPIYTMKVLP